MLAAEPAQVGAPSPKRVVPSPKRVVPSPWGCPLSQAGGPLSLGVPPLPSGGQGVSPSLSVHLGLALFIARIIHSFQIRDIFHNYINFIRIFE